MIMRTLNLKIVVFFLLMLAPFAAYADEPDPALFALLVGINDYHDTLDPLDGSLQDVKAFRAELLGRWHLLDDPEHLVDLSAYPDRETRAGIAGAFRDIVLRAAQTPGATIVFYYAGHGARVEDEHTDDADGYASTIVPIDGRLRGQPVRDIRGSELRSMILAANRLGVNVVTIFDSCHSAGVTRSGARALPFHVREAAGFALAQAAGAEPLPTIPVSRASTIPGINVHLAAVKDSELSIEVGDAAGQWHGLFTAALVSILHTAPPDMSYADILAALSKVVHQPLPLGTDPVHPNGVGSLTARFLGHEGRDDGVFVAHSELVDRKPVPGLYRIEGGTLTGILPGNQFRAFARAADTRLNGAAPLFSGTVLTSQPTAAKLRADRSTALLPDLVFLKPIHPLAGWAPLSVRLAASSASQLATLRSQLEDLPFVHEKADAAIALTVDVGQQVQLVDRRGERMSDAWSLSSTEDLHTVMTRLSKYRYIEMLSSPPGRVSLDIVGGNCLPDAACPTLVRKTGVVGTLAVADLCERQQFSLRIVNQGDVDQHLTMLDLASNYGIALIYPPNANDDQVLAAGHAMTYRPPFLPVVYDNGATDSDLLMLIATSHKLANAWFPQEGIKRITLPSSKLRGIRQIPPSEPDNDSFSILKMIAITHSAASAQCSQDSTRP